MAMSPSAWLLLLCLISSTILKAAANPRVPNTSSEVPESRDPANQTATPFHHQPPVHGVLWNRLQSNQTSGSIQSRKQTAADGESFLRGIIWIKRAQDEEDEENDLEGGEKEVEKKQEAATLSPKAIWKLTRGWLRLENVPRFWGK